MHVVFGRVVGGFDVVRQIENLPVDTNSRPLQDVKIVKCGELIRQVKGEFKRFCDLHLLSLSLFVVKKEKKKVQSEGSESEDADMDKRSKKKAKKEKKREKKEKSSKKM